MKKAIFLGIVIFVFGFFVWFFFFRFSLGEVKNYPSSGTQIIAFGDSLIEGVGSTKGNDLVSLLSTRLGTPIQNFGLAGDTTTTALERLPEVLDKIYDPKVVIILLGGNDFLKKIPREKTFANLSQIITAFQGRGAVVLLLGIRGGLIKDNFQNEFENLAQTYHTAYVSNVLSGLVGKVKYMYDSVHPNDVGYQKVADRVYPVFEKLVK